MNTFFIWEHVWEHLGTFFPRKKLDYIGNFFKICSPIMYIAFSDGIRGVRKEPSHIVHRGSMAHVKLRCRMAKPVGADDRYFKAFAVTLKNLKIVPVI